MDCEISNTQDGNDYSGAIEYVYSIMAENAGLEMPATHLFPSQKGGGYFAVKDLIEIKISASTCIQ